MLIVTVVREKLWQRMQMLSQHRRYHCHDNSGRIMRSRETREGGSAQRWILQIYEKVTARTKHHQQRRWNPDGACCGRAWASAVAGGVKAGYRFRAPELYIFIYLFIFKNIHEGPGKHYTCTSINLSWLHVQHHSLFTCREDRFCCVYAKYLYVEIHKKEN